MHAAYEFLFALTIVLGVAAITTVVFAWLRQPVVLGYILAGFIIGPHLPIPVDANPEVVFTLSELGVILLMFALGLEFSLAKLFRAAPTAGVTAVIQCSAMVVLGYAAGRMLGWTPMESFFAGAIVSVSSTTIIAKAFDEQQVKGRLRELVVAILIVEDLIAVLLMAVLTTVATGAGLSADELAKTLAQLLGFLVAVVAGGLIVVPRVIRAIVKLGRAETTIVAAVGICFAISVLAHEVGYSVALGAFLAGVLVAESGESHTIEPLLWPVRDIFAAVFFVSVGMMIDPALIAQHWLAVVVFTGVVVVGKVVTVAFGAFLTGAGTRTSVAAGMSLAQIGEFSFIIASLGLTLGAIRDFLYPVAVAVSALTTLLTPWLIRVSGRASTFVDRLLPPRLQTFVSLYESWIDRLRSSSGPAASSSQVRRLVRVLLVDVAVIVAILVGVSLSFDALIATLVRQLELDRASMRIIVVAAAGLIALPFCVGILLTSRRLAIVLADLAVPRAHGKAPDLGQAARRTLGAALRLGGLLIAGLPLLALTVPFLPAGTGVIVFLAAVIGLAIAFWRRAADLEGHVRAAAQVVIEALASGSRAPAAVATETDQLAAARALLPGLGEPTRVVIPATSHAVGRTLAQLDLRGSTGATVLAISRGEVGIAVPGAHDVIQAGDCLAIAGSQRAIAGATRLLTSPTSPTVTDVDDDPG